MTKNKNPLEDLKHKIHDVKDKVVIINDAEVSESQMGEIASRIKKAGAIEVMFAYGGIELQTLSDEDLTNIGLCRIKKGDNNAKESKKTEKEGSKEASKEI